VPCWPISEKQSLSSTSAQVGDTWSLKGSIAQLDSQNRKFAPILNITEAKNAHFFVCKRTGFTHQRLKEFVNMTLTRVSSHWLWHESSHSVKNVTRVESPSFSTWLRRVQVTKNRDSNHWLCSRYQIFITVQQSSSFTGDKTFTIGFWFISIGAFFQRNLSFTFFF